MPVTLCQRLKNDYKNYEENIVKTTTTVATLKLDGVSIDIYDNSSSQFIRNLADAFMYIK